MYHGRGVSNTPSKRHPQDGECAKHVNFQGYSFHKWNVWRAYAIRPYRVTQKHGTFSILHTYPAIFPGLGRGLDFLLPSFLSLMKEKKVEAVGIRHTERHPKDSECTKRVNFSGYNDRTI